MADHERIVWEPAPEYFEGTHLQGVMRRLRVSDYDDLYQLSIESPGRFWQATLDDIGIEWIEPYREFIDVSHGPEWPRWFLGGKINIAQSAVTRWARTAPERVAVAWEDERGRSAALSYGELERQMTRLAAGLRALGVRPGDTVGMFVPMCPETAIAYMAIVAVGAVCVPMFSGYGDGAVASRLTGSGARVLVTADGFHRRGRYVPMKEIADRAIDAAGGVTGVVVIPHSGAPDTPMRGGRDTWWDDALALAPPAEGGLEPMDPNDPMMSLYTSGTTGRPKGTVHIHGGMPLKMTQDLAHCTNTREGSVSVFTSDFGWLAGPGILVSNLNLGATSVVYTGAPDHPAPDQVWKLVERYRATHLWLPPTLVRALRSHGEEPIRRHDLSSLEVLPSTGEPWDADSYLWYVDVVGRRRLPVSNYIGGTEIGGGILGCVLNRPITAAGFNTAIPGVAADVFDEAERPVVDQVGELVITRPFVGMTRGFWNDPERYLETYWCRFPGVWVHGDWVERSHDGHWRVQGRSDDTIKVAGKRFGPAEIEGIVLTCAGVRDAAAIGVPDPVKGSALVVMVVPATPGLDAAELRSTVEKALDSALGRAMKPSAFHVVPALPYTRTAKLMRRAVRAAYLGADPGDLSGMENPEALDALAAVRPAAPSAAPPPRP